MGLYQLNERKSFPLNRPVGPVSSHVVSLSAIIAVGIIFLLFRSLHDILKILSEVHRYIESLYFCSVTSYLYLFTVLISFFGFVETLKNGFIMKVVFGPFIYELLILALPERKIQKIEHISHKK